MKRIIFLLFLLYPIAIFSQDTYYRPFIEEGKTWVTFSSNGYVPVSLRYDTIAGDTIVCGKKCKRWKQRYVVRGTGEVRDYTIAAFEENKKVFFFFRGDTHPRLMFDFGAQVGDTLSVSVASAAIWDYCVKNESYLPDNYKRQFEDSLLITKRDAVIERGGRRQSIVSFAAQRSLTFADEYAMMVGIGSAYSPSWNLGSFGPFPGSILAYCCIADEVLYINQWIVDWADIPLPTSITSPRSPQMVNGKSVNSTWLDLSGRRLSASPTRPGVYLRDGRKVLVK